MVNQDQRRAAVEALESARAHQERTRRAARVPWWFYPVTFVVVCGACAANDVVSLSGAKLIAGLVLVAMIVVLAVTVLGRSAPLSRIRGVQGPQTFVPWLFGLVVVVVGIGGWLASRYGVTWVDDVARATGLGRYPNTVAGVLFGAAATALLALVHVLSDRARRPPTR